MIQQSHTGLVIGMLVGDILARQEVKSTISFSCEITEAFQTLPDPVTRIQIAQTNLLLALLIGATHSDRPLPILHNPAANASMILGKLARTDTDPVKYMEHIWKHCSGNDPSFDMTLRKVGHVLGFGSTMHATRLIKTSSIGGTVFTTALYSIMRYPDDFSKAMRVVTRTPYQPHIATCITGAIIGMRHGEDSISSQWRKLLMRTVDLRDYLSRLPD